MHINYYMLYYNFSYQSNWWCVVAVVAVEAHVVSVPCLRDMHMCVQAAIYFLTHLHLHTVPVV